MFEVVEQPLSLPRPSNQLVGFLVHVLLASTRSLPQCVQAQL